MSESTFKYQGPKTVKEGGYKEIVIDLAPGWDGLFARYTDNGKNKEAIGKLKLLHDLAFADVSIIDIMAEAKKNGKLYELQEVSLKDTTTFSSGLAVKKEDGFRPINDAIATGIMTKFLALKSAPDSVSPEAAAARKGAMALAIATVYALIEEAVRGRAAKAREKTYKKLPDLEISAALSTANELVIHHLNTNYKGGSVSVYINSTLLHLESDLRNEAEPKKIEVQLGGKEIHSLNRPYSKGDAERGVHQADERLERAEDIAEKKDDVANIEALKRVRLTPKEREVIELRFGLNENKKCTRGETAQQMGVSITRIGQLQQKALEKLRQADKPKKPISKATTVSGWMKTRNTLVGSVYTLAARVNRILNRDKDRETYLQLAGKSEKSPIIDDDILEATILELQQSPKFTQEHADFLWGLNEQAKRNKGKPQTQEQDIQR